MKSSKSKILMEMFSVVFAILLALFINEWREKTANDRLAGNSLRHINLEMRSNLERVQKLLIQNKGIKDEQMSAFDKIKIELNKKSSEFNEDEIFALFPMKLMVEPVRNTAWASASLTQAIKYFDKDLILLLSLTYVMQEEYSTISEQLLDRLTSPGLYKKETMKSELQGYFIKFTMYIQNAESLIKEYENCLHELALNDNIEPVDEAGLGGE